MSTPTPEETISYPSIALVLALGFVLYRYFFASQSPSAPSSSTPTRNNGLRFTPAQVDQVSAMFPQLSRRDIMWDLQRNRGSVQGTIERVLGGGRLDAVSTPLTSCERNALLGQVQRCTHARTYSMRSRLLYALRATLGPGSPLDMT